MNSKKGFTLLEVLVVTVIAAAVLLFAVPAYKRAQDKSTYTAALGILTELRGGVMGLRQDLDMAGSAHSFPVSTSAEHINTGYFNESLSTYTTTMNQDIKDVEQSNLIYALFSHKYMQPIPALDNQGAYKSYYQFWACGKDATGVACCVNNSTTNTVACMLDYQRCGRATKGLYYGARIDERGQVTQIEDNCGN